MKLKLYGNPKRDYFHGIITYDPNCADCRGAYMRADYPKKCRIIEEIGCVYLCEVDLSVLLQMMSLDRCSLKE